MNAMFQRKHVKTNRTLAVTTLMVHINVYAKLDSKRKTIPAKNAQTIHMEKTAKASATAILPIPEIHNNPVMRHQDDANATLHGQAPDAMKMLMSVTLKPRVTIRTMKCV